MVAVAITRTELTAADLRGAAARARDADAVRRMLALALVLDEHSREDALEACGMDRHTLRDWVHYYNAEGGSRACPTGAHRGASRPPS